MQRTCKEKIVILCEMPPGGYNEHMENGGKKTEDFLRETVTKRSAGRRRAKRAGALVLAAVVFGLIACLTFVLARPLLESRLGHWTEEEETISFPEEVETSPEGETESAAESGGAESPEGSASGTPAAPGEGQEPTEPQPLTPAERIANANRMVVRVRADGTEGDTGFAAGDTETAGILFSATSRQGFLLADYSVMDGCTSFVVTLRSGTETAGTLRGTDSVTGLAVIGVDLEVLDHAGLTGLFPNASGSGTLRPGDTVAVVGMPHGHVYSGSVGQVVYNELGIPMEDSVLAVLHTNLDLQGSSFLLNEGGDLVGVSTRQLQQSGTDEFYGITSLRPFLERLANGRSVAYLGVIAVAQGETTAVSEQMTEQGGAPHGAVVDSVVLGSPAYESGIQAGDIITDVNGITVYDAATLQQAILEQTPGTVVEVTVFRQGRDIYTEQVFQVTAGVR